MAAVLAIARQILAYLLQVWAFLQGLADAIEAIDKALGIIPGGQTIWSRLAQIGVDTDATHQAVDDAVYGLNALHNEHVGLRGVGDYDLDDVMTAIAATQQGGDPVNLPVVPPAGYGAPSADEVWQAIITPIPEPGQNVNYTFFEAAYLLGALYIRKEWEGGTVGLPFPGNPDFLYFKTDLYTGLPGGGSLSGFQGAAPAVVDWSLWDGSESLVAFLNAHEATYAGHWSSTGPGSVTNAGYAWYCNTSTGTGFRCKWRQSDLPFVSGLWKTLVQVDLQPVLDAIDDVRGLDARDLTEVWDKVDAIPTNPITSLQPVLDAIDALPVPVTSLQPVLDAIAALPTPVTSLQPVLDAIDALPTPITSLQPVLDAIAALPVPVTSLQPVLDAIALIPTNPITSLQPVLDAIDALVIPAAPLVPPVWPGLAGVTLGTPVAISGSMRVEATMDGVLIDITTPPTRTGLRVLGGAYYDYGVGELAFENDDGYIEMWQYLGFRTMMLVPKTMVRAGACVFRLLAGAEGTLTPWTISS